MAAKKTAVSVKASPKSKAKRDTTSSSSRSSAKVVNPAGLGEGDQLPDVTLLDQDGKSVSLSSFKGSPLVLYFYPKDDTPGCTREACSFQENLGALKKAKAKVVGVSADPIAKHRKFADKYGLNFPLLVDENRALMTRLGVIGEKVLYGKKSLGIIRTTFIVDESLVIRKVFRKVKVEGHLDQVMEALKTLR